MNENLNQVSVVATEATSLQVSDQERAAIVATLQPVATRLPAYQQFAETCVISTKPSADNAASILGDIDRDNKSVTEAMEPWISRVFQFHRRCTGLRNLFTDPLAAAKGKIKGKLIAWQEAERKAAEELQAKLQAEADEKARKEAERLTKEAGKLKTPEKVQERLEAAASIVAPTVRIEAQTVTGLRVQKRWVVKSVDLAEFLSAAAKDRNLWGYITVESTKLQRTKSANTMLEVPGVVFEQRAC